MKKRNGLVLLLVAVLTVMMVVSAIPVGAVSVSVEDVSSTDSGKAPNSSGAISVDTGNPALDDTVPVGQPGEGYTPTGTGISTAEEFNNMDPNGSYYLTADITVSKTISGFKGVFDGNGHTVDTTVSLFADPQFATIKNLTVVGSVPAVKDANSGVVAKGTAVGCNFFNILNKASMAVAEGADVNGYTRASGIAGRTAGYTIFERCTNEGSIHGYAVAAGICALLSADLGSEAVVINCVNKGAITSDTHNAAGIVNGVECKMGTTLIYNCRNEGAVTGAQSVGGIVAYALNASGVRISGCSNAGSVTGTVSGSATKHAGGIIGESNSPLTIENCVNEASGTILIGRNTTSTQTSAGGMIGRLNEAEILISGCQNHASIEGSGQSGGIAGWLMSYNITLQNCQNYGAVTSRLNYCAGIVCRADSGANYYGAEIYVLISDCTNEGKVTSKQSQSGGISAYSQSPITFVRCVNKGEITFREDISDGVSLTAGGIMGNMAAYATFIDCRNEGAIISRNNGNVGGIIGSSGSNAYYGATRLIGCVNIGDVLASGTWSNVVGNGAAGGLIGYQYGATYTSFPVIRYCVNTGNVSALGCAGYALGYSNMTYGCFMDNVFAGTLTTTASETGKNTKGSSLCNVLLFDNASTLDPACYARNWVVDSFTGPLVNNVGGTDAGNVVAVPDENEFSTGDDPFDVMTLFVLTENPRDEAAEIWTATDFMSMESFGGNYRLMADITLTETYSGTAAGSIFGSTLDGNGHTLTISRSVFNQLAASAEISNLTLAGAVSATAKCGALAVRGAGRIINVTNTASVTVDGSTNASYAGGFFGDVTQTGIWMENCVNTGKITNTSTGTDAFAGGISGFTSGKVGNYIGCVNTGEVSGKSHTGGIIGSSQVLGTTYIRCVNTGKITSTATAGNIGAGGIQGYSGTNVVYFIDCYNGGEISSGRYAAGICGDSAKGLVATNCVNTGNVTCSNTTGLAAGGIYNHHNDNGCTTIKITGGINTGAISGKGDIGGIAGTSHAIAAGNHHILTGCVNLGSLTSTVGSLNVGGLMGYVYAGAAMGFQLTNCIAGGSVSTTGACCGAVVGYSNTKLATIQNCIIFATLSASSETFRYYRSGSIQIDEVISTISGNICTGSLNATYDACSGSSGSYTRTWALNTWEVTNGNEAVLDKTLTRRLLLLIGTTPGDDGVFSFAISRALGIENDAANKLEVYDSEGTLLGTVSSFGDASALLPDGGSIKLMSDYYVSSAPGAAHLVLGGGTYTVEGNGYAIYSASASSYAFGISGSGTATVKGLRIYSQGEGVRIGVNRLGEEMNVTFENAKIYAASQTENGYFTAKQGSAIYYNVAPRATAELTGEDTVVKAAAATLLYVRGGVLNIRAGTYRSNFYQLQTPSNSDDGVLINIYGGDFVSDGAPDAIVSIEKGCVSIFGGIFTSKGMCVARVLGGKTKNEMGADNTITTPTNATLNISGGVFILEDGTRSENFCAVIRCGGGTTYGTVNISGGTFIDQRKTSAQIILKNNTCASVSITGGRFLATADQTFFFKTNGNANVELEDGYRPSSSHENIAIDKTYSPTVNYAGETYYFWTLFGATDPALAIETLSGAQVRMTAGSTGLRFISRLTADQLAAARALAGEGGTVSFGTVIAPMSYVAAAEAFTMEALNAAEELAGVATKYINIVAQNGIIENEDGSVEIRAALTNIKEENLTCAFAGIAYIKVTTADGMESYLYGAFDGADNVRAIRQVAEAALADTSTKQTDIYKYAVTDDAGEILHYSKYNEYQRSVLAGFSAIAE